MGLGEIRLGEMGLGEMGLGEMGQNLRRIRPDDSKMTPKGGTQQFRVKNQKQNLSSTFCTGTLHTDRCQCVVLSRLTFSATTIFATVGL